MVADPANMAALKALGARSVPIVARGDAFTYAQSIRDVVDFLGLDEDVGPELEPHELVDRIDRFLEAAARYCRQVPDGALENQLPNRPRSWRVLMHHIFQIPLSFVEATAGGRFEYDRMVAPPPDDLTSSEAIAAFGEDVRARVRTWWLGVEDTSLADTIETYYGVQPLHEVLERVTWHSGQHVRQVMSLLESIDIAPDRPLTMADFAGLPVTEKVWDD